ncbi:hypothetical protein SK128_025718 [Halocaridina rubra]|uniref:Chitin-binding type-2 domain-containing protein n=1 Tax=Halocaridina rubra TaxID=373956 RepID=A0AAN9A5Q9_HALRR
MDEGGWCGEGSAWDINTRSCTSGDVSCSPPSCWGLPNGPHPTPASSCNGYFTCSNGVRTDHVCPYQMIYDYYYKKCLPISSSVCYEQACGGRINGLHSVPNAPCQVYLRCFNGALISLESCPRNHIFDGQKCVVSEKFSCWGGGRGNCQGRRDGYHTIPTSECHSYFLCRHQQLIQSFRCSPGLIFNGKECVQNDNFVCNSQANIPDCTNKINGFYTVERTSCKSFYFCQSGKKLSEHTCPGNNMFNGEQCVDPVLYQCSDFERVQQQSNLTNRFISSS